MSSQTNSSTQISEKAKSWLKPDQIEDMQDAALETGADFLQERNEAIILLMYDTGLRNAELCLLDVDMFDLEDRVLHLPPEVQKDYPTDRSPELVPIGLSRDTVRTLRKYIRHRHKDTEALFPSRQSDRISTGSVRNVIKSAAVAAEVRPHQIRGRGEPEDVHPHSLRHSVAYRMIKVEDKTIYDVSKRLRHTSVLTTERIYSHFDRV